MAIQPNLASLKSKLAAAKVRETDYVLFEFLNRLLDSLTQSQVATDTIVSTISGSEIAALTTTINNLKQRNYLTHSDESAILTNSRELLAGTNTSFDDSIAGERTINVSADNVEWSVLTNGDPVTPELMWDSNGDVIMTEMPR